MKNIVIAVAFFLAGSSSLLAQSGSNQYVGKVTYKRVLNFDGDPNTTMFNLLINSGFSVFYEAKADSRKEDVTVKQSSDDEFDLTFDIKINGSKHIVVTDFEKGTIQSQVSVYVNGEEKTYVVEEDISAIQWDIVDEYKTIDRFKAQKAVGNFRGRKYVVWFTNQIPVKFGPWKLNGLPGLILSVVDDRNEVMFFAKEIKIPFSSDAKIEKEFRFNKDFERISLAEYLKLKKEQVAEVMQLFNSKLPRGARLEMVSCKTNDLELEYEEEAIRN